MGKPHSKLKLLIRKEIQHMTQGTCQHITVQYQKLNVTEKVL